MIKALLFDLDDTLLLNDMDDFIPEYLKALTRKLAHLVPPVKLANQLMRSTQVMMANTDPDRTNQEIFLAHFFENIGQPRGELMPIIEEFYANDFPQLQGQTTFRPEARPLVKSAFRNGYEVVIATNAVFPRTAIEQRLDWAGVGDFDYALITTYENMHFCKPRPGYYLEIADRLGRPPEQCLMAGNDVKNDIRPAAEAGMHTFWVTDSSDGEVEADYHGGLTDLRKLIDDEVPNG